MTALSSSCVGRATGTTRCVTFPFRSTFSRLNCVNKGDSINPSPSSAKKVKSLTKKVTRLDENVTRQSGDPSRQSLASLIASMPTTATLPEAKLGTSNMEAVMKHVESTLLPQLFGYEEFRPGQRQVVESILSGKSTLAILPTAAGKSLCYMLPSQLLDGLTLVVSPLLAMMRDQVAALKEQGIAAVRLDSSMTFDEIVEATRDLREGRVKVLFVSPERFNNERFRQLISSIKVALFVVDEGTLIKEEC